MDQTFFYIVGISLVVLAISISMIGLRNESFPSNGVLRAGVALMAAVVVLTAAAAVSSSGQGEEKKATEGNREASATAATNAATNEEVGGGGSASGSQATPSQPATGPGDGAAVFAENGCGGCHTLAAANTTGQVGPVLDEALAKENTTFIKTSIVDPSAFVAPGYPDGVMPSDFGTRIAPADLTALVTYLSQSTSGK